MKEVACALKLVVQLALLVHKYFGSLVKPYWLVRRLDINLLDGN